MKRTLLITGSLVLIGIFIIGNKVYSDINEIFAVFHREHNLDDSNFILIKTKTSPNHQYRFYEYKFDNGGFGYSRVFWSVIKNDSTERDLIDGLLPDGYKAIDWTNGNELIVEKWEPYYYKEREVELTDGDTINRVLLKLKR